MKKHVLLVAEDDDTDALLLERALRRVGSPFDMVRVQNGEDAIHYVEGTGRFADRAAHPAPHLVLLDLKMPLKDGFAVLRWRQQGVSNNRIPMIVFSSSALKQDVDHAYSLGANSYVVKPTAPGRLESMVNALQHWWGEFNIVSASSAVG